MCKFYRRLILICILIMSTSFFTSEIQCNTVKNDVDARLGQKVDSQLGCIANVKKQFGLKGDGVTNDSDALGIALKSGKQLYFPAGTYLINKAIINKNVNVKMYGHNVVFKGTGGFKFNSDLSPNISTSDVINGDKKITSSLSCSVGDYIQVSGNIAHLSYLPSRYITTKFVAKVVNIIGGVIKIDRPINFSLTNVTTSKILNPYNVEMSGITFDGISVSINNSININIEMTFKGVVSIPLSINQSCNVTIKYKGLNLNKTTLGLVINDCNNFNVDMVGNYIGKQDGTGAKAIRGNGLQNGVINAILDSSYIADSVIYGSRNIKLNIVSTGGGKYYRDNNIVTGNRLESVQFSECDNLQINAQMNDVNDQAIELLACYYCTIKAKINTLINATEGAIVIKGGSQNITIIEPIIRCNNNYAIKIECTDNIGSDSVSNARTNHIKIIKPSIVNSMVKGTGISVRDLNIVTYSVDVDILGGYVKASTPIAVSINPNNVRSKLVTFVVTNNGNGY